MPLTIASSSTSPSSAAIELGRRPQPAPGRASFSIRNSLAIPIALPTAGSRSPAASRSPVSSSSRIRRWRTASRTGSGVASSSRSSSSSARSTRRSPTASVNAQTEPGTASATSAADVVGPDRLAAAVERELVELHRGAAGSGDARSASPSLDEPTDPLGERLGGARARASRPRSRASRLDPAGERAALRGRELADRAAGRRDGVGQALRRGRLGRRLAGIEDRRAALPGATSAERRDERIAVLVPDRQRARR